ncbi:MAG: hypothetical protein EOP35_22690 [Rubrivivax sp.]|nr:MAG: hypothetical protein EOP35_22690 [Rubrivivax sp.]
MLNEKDAAVQADNLLNLLIQNQPSLFSSAAKGIYGEGAGRDYGEAIAMLRLKLIDMYKTQP